MKSGSFVGFGNIDSVEFFTSFPDYMIVLTKEKNPAKRIFFWEKFSLE